MNLQELAGRTMDFTFDVAQTPLIGRRILLKSETGSIQNLNRNNGQAVHLNHNISGTPNSPRRSASLSPADTAPLSGWKRPWLSQSRVREGLVNLLTTCGQRAVGLPKSPSVRYMHDYFMNLLLLVQNRTIAKQNRHFDFIYCAYINMTFLLFD